MLFCYDGRMLICPHCERELGVEHDARGCRRNMSRRHFFGLLAAAFGAVAIPPKRYPAGISIELVIENMDGFEVAVARLEPQHLLLGSSVLMQGLHARGIQ